MGFEQVIFKGFNNLEEDLFKNVFGELYAGKVELECLTDEELAYTSYIPIHPEHYRVLILYRENERHAQFDEKVSYFTIPKGLSDKNIVLLSNNIILSNISYAFLNLEKEDIINHKNKDCVNSVRFFLNESLESIDSKLLKKGGLCVDCHRKFDLDVKDKFINGLPYLISTSYASSSQSWL